MQKDNRQALTCVAPAQPVGRCPARQKVTGSVRATLLTSPEPVMFSMWPLFHPQSLQIISSLGTHSSSPVPGTTLSGRKKKLKSHGEQHVIVSPSFPIERTVQLYQRPPPPHPIPKSTKKAEESM